MIWLSQQSAEFWAIVLVGLLLAAAIGEMTNRLSRKLVEIVHLLRDRGQ